MTDVSDDHSRAKRGCLGTLVLFSAVLAAGAYPHDWWFLWFILFGLHALVSIFVSVGWVIPFTMAGTYFGMFVLVSPIRGGSIESKMQEEVAGIIVGTFIGFCSGCAADLIFPTRKMHNRTAEIRKCDEPIDTSD